MKYLFIRSGENFFSKNSLSYSIFLYLCTSKKENEDEMNKTEEKKRSWGGRREGAGRKKTNPRWLSVLVPKEMADYVDTLPNKSGFINESIRWYRNTLCLDCGFKVCFCSLNALYFCCYTHIKWMLKWFEYHRFPPQWLKFRPQNLPRNRLPYPLLPVHLFEYSRNSPGWLCHSTAARSHLSQHKIV